MSEEIKERVIKGKDKELSPADLKKKSLETALAKIEKAYGKGTVINMAARP
ncbi:MAG: DNA recombination/repair protein RecA, partial [Porphyromonadaceae bacterium]|nr:DNA recombination/repair protein RecA [Porphyromonadaceae bacterium]